MLLGDDEFAIIRPSMPKRASAPILIAGDLFRLEANDAWGGFVWNQAHNMAWLRNLARAIFGSVPALSIDVLDHAMLALKPVAFGPAVEAYADPLWLERMAAPVAPDLAGRIAEAVAGKLVLAFELPANLRDLIGRHAALLVHLAVSPIRFADDVFLDVSCVDPEIGEALAGHAVSDRELFWQAGLVRAALEPPAKVTAGLPDDILLIADQIGNDRAMIVDGAFTSLGAYRDRLAELAGAHALTLLRPHPHRPRIADFDRLAGLPRLRLTNANSYALMASGKVKTVTAVSSSLLGEAPYFGVDAVRLATPDCRRDAPPETRIRVGALAGPIGELLAKRLGHPLPPRGTWQPERDALPDLRRFARDDWGLSKANRNTPILSAADLGAMAPGEMIPASDDAFADGLGQGWHGREVSSVWSAADSATLAFRWPGTDPARIRLDFELFALGLKGQDNPPVELFIGAERHASGAVEQRTTLSCIVDRPEDGLPIQIRLCSRTLTAADRGSTGDRRTLGIALFGMRWSVECDS